MIAASVYMIVFRAFHILAGAVWVGALSLLVLYLQPTAKAIGPAAGPFMQELVAKRKLPNFILGMGAITLVAGVFVYIHDVDVFGGFSDFLDTSFGGTLTFGAVLAIVGWFIGLLRVKPLTNRAMAMAGRLAAAGTPPSPEDVAALQGTQRQARRFAIIVLVLLVVAILAMATARYW